MKIKYSILICAHKYNDWLFAALTSAFHLEYSELYEVILVLNGEAVSDFGEIERRSRTLLESEIIKRNVSFKLIKSEFKGLRANLNVGAAVATGKYIVRLDADDICFPSRLRVYDDIDSRLKGVEPILIGGAAILVSEADELVPSESSVRSVKLSTSVRTMPRNNADTRRMLSYKNAFIHPTTRINREVLLELGGYAFGELTEDFDLWQRISRAYPQALLINSSEPMIFYRIHNNQMSGRRQSYAELASIALREAMLQRSLTLFTSALLFIVKYFLWRTRR